MTDHDHYTLQPRELQYRESADEGRLPDDALVSDSYMPPSPKLAHFDLKGKSMTQHDAQQAQQQYESAINGFITVDTIIINLRLLATAEYFPPDGDHDESRIYLYFPGSGTYDHIYRGEKAEHIYAVLRNLSVVM